MTDGGTGTPGGTDPPVRSRHDWSLDSAFEAVVAAVAVAADRDPVSLAPLHDRVDTEALDALFSTASPGGSPDGLSVTFAYEGFEVTVDGDGSVTVLSGREWRG